MTHSLLKGKSQCALPGQFLDPFLAALIFSDIKSFSLRGDIVIQPELRSDEHCYRTRSRLCRGKCLVGCSATDQRRPGTVAELRFQRYLTVKGTHSPVTYQHQIAATFRQPFL